MLKESITNLFVLGVAIVLVYVAKRNFKDYFVPNVRQTPIGNGPTNIFPSGPNLLRQQPMQFKDQMWPVRVPLEPNPQTPCGTSEYAQDKDGRGRVECPGATGICQDGVCQPKKFDRTVFGIDTSMVQPL